MRGLRAAPPVRGAAGARLRAGDVPLRVVEQPTDDEIEARVDEHADLLDRLDGDSAALGELFERVTGARCAA